MKKTTNKASKAKATNVGGRPSKYKPAYAEQARKLALLGQTDEQVAEFFGIGKATLYRWQAGHEGFRDSMLAGKERADADVAESLYRTALGGSTVTEVREEPDSEGNIIRKKVTRELPADVRAQRYWLGNRRPHQWRDKVVVEDQTPPEAIAEKANEFVALMAAARERQRQVLIERGILPPEEA
ncbi:helix-turn-helix domain-containing protein [Lysobacter zhanggongensis]